MKMLIADDNLMITKILGEFARKEGYESVIAQDGEEALKQFHRHSFDMILLDVIMPKMDGFEVCRAIRQESSVPVIIITARGEDFERIMGLDIGADDYIVKPFSGAEVMARVRAVMRRISETPENKKAQKCLKRGNLSISLETASVTIGEQPVLLTKKELEILWTLAENPKKVFTRENLLNSLWGFDYYGDNRTVDSHMKRLRAKLDAVEHSGWQIKTVWGMGYQFEEDVHETSRRMK